ncbi:hypothetical protein [Paraburkholderia azotifigens]|uniref:hypothetical protein n=1 Tax=Paraburkholderia azotifigens TaxID=2057004 RepID=UPI003B8A81F2
MPAIVDRGAGISLFESGAILLFLAGKTGEFVPMDATGRADVLQWLFWQAANLGPILGQTVFFRNYADEHVPRAIDRFTRESGRLYRVLDTRLERRKAFPTCGQDTQGSRSSRQQLCLRQSTPVPAQTD